MKTFLARRVGQALLLCLAIPAIGAVAVDKPVVVPETPRMLAGAEMEIYRDLSPEPLRMHIFKPKDWKASDHRVAFIWFFGGGWTTGTPVNSVWSAKWAASLGFVAFAPDYRVKSRFGTSPLESVADARLALRWVQTHATELGLDPKRVVVGGNSAGGHVALWTAITHTPPGSAADEAPLFKPAALILSSSVSDTSAKTGYTPERFGANALALSPVHQLDEKMPPAIILHGDADKTVPQAQSLALRDKLLATGNTVEFISVPGGSHNFGGELPGWAEKTHQLEEAFLRKQGLLPEAK